MYMKSLSQQNIWMVYELVCPSSIACSSALEAERTRVYHQQYVLVRTSSRRYYVPV